MLRGSRARDSLHEAAPSHWSGPASSGQATHRFLRNWPLLLRLASVAIGSKSSRRSGTPIPIPITPPSLPGPCGTPTLSILNSYKRDEAQSGDYRLRINELHLTSASSCTILANADEKRLRSDRDAAKLRVAVSTHHHDHRYGHEAR